MKEIRVRTPNVEFRGFEEGSGPLVVLCHGFPELWYSWRHQIAPLAKAGYRVLAIDMPGYGETAAPKEPEFYSVPSVAASLADLLDALEAKDAVFVGHDWGAIVCWSMPLLFPQRCRGVVGMSVPFLPRFPIPPTQLFESYAGERFFYINYFQDRGLADAELASDPRRALASFLWTNSADAPKDAYRKRDRSAKFFDVYTMPNRLPGWLSEEDLDYYTAAFEETGFSNALDYYRNLDRSWELSEGLDAKVTCPSMFVRGEHDYVTRFVPDLSFEEWLSDYRGTRIIESCGHWTQQEKPDELTAVLLEFLAQL